MNIAIFGTKSEALYLANQLAYNTFNKVKYFVDNNSTLWEKIIEKIPVISCEKLAEKYGTEVDAVIVSARGTYSRLSIIHQLRKAKINSIGMFKFSAHDYQKDIDMDIQGNSKYVVWINRFNKPIIPYLETNIMNSCNLKCQGCSHFANLFGENEKEGFEQFKKDITRIGEKATVIQLRLLGGEPLLNVDCYKYINYARKIFPDADINIVTNGILIPKQDEELFSAMRESNAGFHISQYEPTLKLKNVIEKKCKENMVDYYFEGEPITEFGKNLSMLGDSNVEIAQAVCLERGCRFFRNGRIYKCPMEGMIDKFIKEYDYKVNISGGFDIYDESIDWEVQLDDYFNNPVSMCQFCAEKCETFEWKVKNRPEAKDWLVEN